MRTLDTVNGQLPVDLIAKVEGEDRSSHRPNRASHRGCQGLASAHGARDKGEEDVIGRVHTISLAVMATIQQACA